MQVCQILSGVNFFYHDIILMYSLNVFSRYFALQCLKLHLSCLTFLFCLYSFDYSHRIFLFDQSMGFYFPVILPFLHCSLFISYYDISSQSYCVLSLLLNEGLPWWLSGRESTSQCRRCGFNPWVRKMPWRKQQQCTPVFLPRTEEPGGLPSMGLQKSQTWLGDQTATVLNTCLEFVHAILFSFHIFKPLKT